MSYNADNYRQMNVTEQARFKGNLHKLKSVQQYLSENIVNRDLYYFCLDDKKQIKNIEIQFRPKNFMHLCGVQYEHNARYFWTSLKNSRVKQKFVKVSSDGSTWQKIDVLEGLQKLGTTEIRITGKGRTLTFAYQNSILPKKSKTFQILLDLDTDGFGKLFPRALRNIKTDNHKLPQAYPVVAIWSDTDKQWLAVDDAVVQVDKSGNIVVL